MQNQEMNYKDIFNRKFVIKKNLKSFSALNPDFN